VPTYCPRRSCEHNATVVLPPDEPASTPRGVCTKVRCVLALAGTGGALECQSYEKGRERKPWRRHLLAEPPAPA